jgi:hypothetical protein
MGNNSTCIFFFFFSLAELGFELEALHLESSCLETWLET